MQSLAPDSSSDDEGMGVLPVSVVICNRNRGHLLARCLPSVLENRAAEIIVVDGQSTDDSVLVAERYGGTVVSDDGRGLGYARHLGVLTASYPYVFFVDTDVVLPRSDLLALMLTELEVTSVVGLHAQVCGSEASNYWEWAQDAHFRLTFNKPGDRNAIGCMAALFRRDVLDQFPPDSYFMGASEDGDLSRRLTNAGYRLAVSQHSVLHRHRADFRSFLRQRLWYGRGNGRLAWRHRAPWLLTAPLAFLAGGAVLAFRRRIPKLIPYLFVHAACVSTGSVVEYAGLLFRETRRVSPRYLLKSRRQRERGQGLFAPASPSDHTE